MPPRVGPSFNQYGIPYDPNERPIDEADFPIQVWPPRKPDMVIAGHPIILDERVRTICGCDIMTINPSDWK